MREKEFEKEGLKLYAVGLKREGLKLYATMDTRELHVSSILVFVCRNIHVNNKGCGNYRNVYMYIYSMYIYSIYTDSLIQTILVSITCFTGSQAPDSTTCTCTWSVEI